MRHYYGHRSNKKRGKGGYRLLEDNQVALDAAVDSVDLDTGSGTGRQFPVRRGDRLNSYRTHPEIGNGWSRLGGDCPSDGIECLHCGRGCEHYGNGIPPQCPM
jgi:hypothetical protein